MSKARNDLYRLMISQLEHDGFESLAVRLRLTGVIDDGPLYQPSDRLMELVKIGLQLEQEQHIAGPPLQSTTEDCVVKDWTEKDIKEEILATLDEKRLEEFPVLKSLDVDKMVQIQIQQIKLVGSKKIYDELDNNFIESSYSPLFAKEHFDLYRWRENFFLKHFPSSPIRTYHCEIDTDHYDTDMASYHITKKFDDIVALATCDRSSLNYVETNNLFDFPDHFNGIQLEILDLDLTNFQFDGRYWNWLEYQSFEEEEVSYREMYDNIGSYEGALSLVAAAHPSRPQALEHIALKKVVSLGISLEKLPPRIRMKVKEGVFNSFEQVQKFITEEGKEILAVMN